MKARLSTVCLLCLVLALAGLVVAMPSAQAATITVTAGQSIQTAVDNANPGDTIKIGSGTFHEAVVVDKDDLTIIGHNTVIQPPGSAEFGVCISSNPMCFSPATVLEDVSVSGITVQKSNGDGFLTLSAIDTTLTQDLATANGLAGFDLEDISGAVLTSDQATNNRAGFLVEEVGEVTLHSDISKSNCFGVAIIAGANVGASNNVITGNTKACSESGPLPATKGLGAFIFETDALLFTHNALQGNGKATSNHDTGGLVITDTATFAGNNVFSQNSFANNLPVDIRTDSTNPSDDSFTDNACSVSVPNGLC